MIITYHGLQFFKITKGDLVLAYNPISKDSKNGKPARFGADIVLVSLNHVDFNGTETLSYGERKPFIISGAGEYERKGVYIKGYSVRSEYDGYENRFNTIYVVILEDIRLCFLGALNTPNITEEIQGDIVGSDILFVPIGGDSVLTSAQAHKLSLSLEPKIIIPMHYGGSNVQIKKFLEETGSDTITPVDKLTLKKKDLEGKEGDVFILKQI